MQSEGMKFTVFRYRELIGYVVFDPNTWPFTVSAKGFVTPNYLHF